MNKRLLSLVTLSFLYFTGLNAQIVINEYCAANRTGYTDNFGENEDWFELYNTSGSTVDISGWYMSDKAGNTIKFQVPAGATVPANGYAIVVCSGRETINGNEIHTNFKLTQTAPEDIVISDATQIPVDQITLERHQQEHSVGRTTDGAATWSWFTTPTPGAANAGAFDGYASKPVFDQAAGYYTGSVTVSITSDPGTTIYYTLNGDQPTTGSTVYSGPITINNTSVLRAFATSSNSQILPSFTETNTYIIDTTHTMLVVSISGGQLPNLIEFGNGWGSEPPGAIEIFDATGQLLDEGEGSYNKHGNDSWAYDQRGFDFIMRDQFGYNHAIQYPLFRTKNRDEFQRLIIKAAANDNYPFEQGAHIRDSYVHSLSHEGDLKLDERTFEPCVLYLNGRYWGVYDIREKVDDNDFTEHYYDQRVPYADSPHFVWFLKTWGGTWQEYGAPLADPAWQSLANYIQTNNMGVQANFDYVDSLYNWHSLVDYFVLNSYIVSQDWLNWNTAWWRGTDTAGDKQKWRYVLWDMDASFGHYVNYTGIPDPSPNADPCNAEALPNPGGQGHTEVLSKLIQENPLCEQYYISRYIDLGNTVFSCDNMLYHLDSLIALIQPEMQGQIDRWGGTMAGWQAEVQELRDFITARCQAIEQGMIDCYDLSGPYDITFDVDPPGAGEIKVNSIWLDQYPFTGTYYGGIDILLKAQANAGYVFKDWEAVDAIAPSVDSIEGSIQVTQNQMIIAHFVEEGDPIYDGVHIPTAFSPNSDGNNDWWFVLPGADVTSVDIKIFNRWGELMYSSTDASEGWDGTYNGVLLNAGVYTYLVNVTYFDGVQQKFSGNITLVR